ncbi:MAG TPA: PQQ-binding-like beta-propeller repeat protein [Candidatus Limnocylindria bacterium]|nr:PQQ-binding-like beta-propeller repeat protein [Candidatus Limnocylindria bacterium]
MAAQTAAEVQRASVQYPGGLSARYRWAGSDRAADVFGVSEATGRLTDHGPLVDSQPDRLCRAELRVEGPAGAWTARFASAIFDEPSAVLWDSHGLLVLAYGFRLYALDGRTGELRWSHDSRTPLVAVLASSTLDHVLLQSEVETIALRADGEIAWRVAHDDVITAAELLAGQLVLTGYGGGRLVLDPRSGREIAAATD